MQHASCAKKPDAQKAHIGVLATFSCKSKLFGNMLRISISKIQKASTEMVLYTGDIGYKCKLFEYSSSRDPPSLLPPRKKSSAHSWLRTTAAKKRLAFISMLYINARESAGDTSANWTFTLRMLHDKKKKKRRHFKRCFMNIKCTSTQCGAGNCNCSKFKWCSWTTTGNCKMTITIKYNIPKWSFLFQTHWIFEKKAVRTAHRTV